tara:strand:- start:479 stop:793 length:315 start_codon:yes stop_codon:yes gene_type:complete
MNERGEGANSIGCEFGFTTNQVDAMIDSYRDSLTVIKPVTIDDEYSPIVKNFIRSNWEGNGEIKLIKMVKENFNYPHSSVYIADIIHHLSIELERERTAKINQA